MPPKRKTIPNKKKSPPKPSLSKKNNSNKGKKTSTQSTPKANPKSKSTKWSDEQDQFLVDRLLEIKEKGNMSENSFKKQLFGEIAKEMEAALPSEIGAAAKTQTSVLARWQKVSRALDHSIISISLNGPSSKGSIR
jgi:hypothetical protein